MAEVLGANLEWVNVLACPVCRSSMRQHIHFATLVDHGLPLSYEFCRRCGVVFQDPKLSDHALETYYQDHYHSQMMPAEEDVQRNIWVQRRRAEYMAEAVSEHLSGPKIYLDVGASRGLMLAEFESRFGVTGYGIEPGRVLRDELLAQGLRAAESVDDLPAELTGKVDLVTMSHVLEHLAYPFDFLRSLRQKWLASDAVVLVEVPNLVWHQSLELAHLTAFQAATLGDLFRNAGYQVIQLGGHGRPYARRMPLFLLLLAAPAQVPDEPSYRPRPWWLVHLKRWYGTSYRRLYERVALLRHGRKKLSPWSDISVD